MRSGSRLNEAVVEIAGDARALLEDGDLLRLLLQAHRLEPCGRLADDDEQELEVVAGEARPAVAHDDRAAAELALNQDRRGEQRLHAVAVGELQLRNHRLAMHAAGREVVAEGARTRLEGVHEERVRGRGEFQRQRIVLGDP